MRKNEEKTMNPASKNPSSTPRPAIPPASGHPASGHPAPGHPASGHPASGHPASGHPASGHPASGHPASGHPAPGHPAPSHPTPPPSPWRSLPALALPTWRSTPRLAPALAAGAGLVLAVSTRLADTPPDALSALNLLRVTALLGALALAFLLDDRSRNITETTPTPRPLKVALRLAPALPLAALWWTAALLLVPAGSRPAPLPVTLEAAAMATTALALATTRIRFTDVAAPGGAAAIGTLAAMAAAALIPARWGLFALPGEPHWPGAHWRWALVLAVTALACAAWTPQPLGRGIPRPLRNLSSPRGTSGPSHA
ncbi:ABC transporter [Streptomyces niveiscabiei]|uniref:ABC transporter n=1 Tax=Streptomyces niveiscabiei TaxID=164115 RepID=UPI0029A16D60|nr:ABC transporter [Streptomyces niveiscabiei]MDX3387848.1 ABC transporter [Streptomyces niveiscabiei]